MTPYYNHSFLDRTHPHVPGGPLFKFLLGTSSENSHSSPVKQEKWLLLSSAPFLHGRKLRADGSGTEVAPAGKEGSGTVSSVLTRHAPRAACCHPTREMGTSSQRLQALQEGRSPGAGKWRGTSSPVRSQRTSEEVGIKEGRGKGISEEGTA